MAEVGTLAAPGWAFARLWRGGTIIGVRGAFGWGGFRVCVGTRSSLRDLHLLSFPDPALKPSTPSRQNRACWGPRRWAKLGRPSGAGCLKMARYFFPCALVPYALALEQLDVFRTFGSSGYARGLQLLAEFFHQFVNRLELFGCRRAQVRGSQGQFAGEQQRRDRAIQFTVELGERGLAGPHFVALAALHGRPDFP